MKPALSPKITRIMGVFKSLPFEFYANVIFAICVLVALGVR